MLGSRIETTLRGSNIIVRGGNEIIALLQELPRALQRKVLAIAAMAGASPILWAARANAQTAFTQRTGSLAKSIRAKQAKQKAQVGGTLVMIGPVHQARTFRRTAAGRWRGVGVKAQERARTTGLRLMKVDPARYGHLVEFGHAGKHPAPTKRPFLRPAFDAHWREAETIIKQKILEGIDIQVAHLRAQSAKS